MEKLLLNTEEDWKMRWWDGEAQEASQRMPFETKIELFIPGPDKVL